MKDEEKKAKIRVMIADDHRLFRQGLRQICELKAGFEVVGEAEDGNEAVKMALETKPEVILMDINMPGLDGVEATQAILAKDPSIKVIFLTMYAQDRYIFEAVKAGALGYLLKDVDWHELIEAVKTVYEGGALLKPELTVLLLEEFRRINKSEVSTTPAQENQLTDGEMDVLVLVAQGLDNEAIAEQLAISKKTVANRLSEIYQKLNVNNRTQAALYALRQGWSTLEPEGEADQLGNDK